MYEAACRRSIVTKAKLLANDYRLQAASYKGQPVSADLAINLSSLSYCVLVYCRRPKNTLV